jgi:hypothetical protein
MIAYTGADVVKAWDRDEITPEIVERFLLDASKGLAEITKGINPRVQFIHESVRGFLLGKGLEMIQPGLSENIVSLSYERLKDCCLRYLEKSETALLPALQLASNTGVIVVESELIAYRGRRSRACDTHPFLHYAVKDVIRHAHLTHSLVRPQHTFVAGFPHRFWQDTITCASRCGAKGSAPEHNLCTHLS